MKKKEAISEYITASEAARILSEKLGRPIRQNYISRMTQTQKHSIRTVKVSPVLWLYNRADVCAAIITHKQPDDQVLATA